MSQVDEYILEFPKDLQERLSQVRSTIKKAAPHAEEKISYGMPAYHLNGPLVYFAAFKNHIGFFPTPSGVDAFKKDLEKYATTKGSIHFPHTQKIPLALITRIVKYRVQENSLKRKSISKRKNNGE